MANQDIARFDQYESSLVHSRISWRGIFAGVFVAFGIQIALTLLGIGIFASTIDPYQDANPMQNIGTGLSIWIGVSMLIAVFAGGWTSAYVSRIGNRTVCVLQGVVAWSVLTLLTLVVAVSAAGKLLGGASTLLGSTFSSLLASPTSAVIAARAIDSAKNTTSGAVVPMGTPDQLAAVVRRMIQTGSFTLDPTERESLANSLSQNSSGSLNHDQALALIDSTITKTQDLRASAEDNLKNVADSTAKGASRGGIWGFVTLLLGALCAGAGGSVGWRRMLTSNHIVGNTLRHDDDYAKHAS